MLTNNYLIQRFWHKTMGCLWETPVPNRWLEMSALILLIFIYSLSSIFSFQIRGPKPYWTCGRFWNFENQDGNGTWGLQNIGKFQAKCPPVIEADFFLNRALCRHKNVAFWAALEHLLLHWGGGKSGLVLWFGGWRKRSPPHWGSLHSTIHFRLVCVKTRSKLNWNYSLRFY